MGNKKVWQLRILQTTQKIFQIFLKTVFQVFILPVRVAWPSDA